MIGPLVSINLYIHTTVSVVRYPIIPMVWPLLSTFTDGLMYCCISGTLVKLIFEQIIGKFMFFKNGTNPLLPSSNSWLPNDCNQLWKNENSVKNTCYAISLFRNKRYIYAWWNDPVKRFKICHISFMYTKTESCFIHFSFRATLFFPSLVYVDIDQFIH